MRWSKMFIPTLKEDPQEAEAVSHKLMMRAGLIRRLSSGTYNYLPMGYRSLRKAENIIREEMAKAGAFEILMPALHPTDLWKKTGRYEDMGEVMIKYKDRHGREGVLGPTHEEIVTSLVAGEVRSYKDLPIILYQIQTKFRDEARPRFGVIRSCEFIMKDAYSFDTDVENMEKSYRLMYDAYCRIFDRCGLPYVAVEADPGLMGGTVSHEFMVPAEVGEDRIILCSSCKYAASTEVAAVNMKEGASLNADVPEKMKEVATPGKSSVQDVCAFLGINAEAIIKTLIYIADEKPVAVLIRGDHEANETKIKGYLKARVLELAGEKTVEKETGGAMGFSGPVGLSMRIVADNSVKNIVNGVVGSNRKDTHFLNVKAGRDFEVKEWFDARVITASDPCPKCGGVIELKQAIEIGHTFKLGTKYTKTLEASFLDEKGKSSPIIMGCYGIGVNRILASFIERSHDANGIIWSRELAPCEVVVIPVKKDDKNIVDEAERVYAELMGAGMDVIIDDREKSPGIKFKDSDLVGFPVQVVIGKRAMDEGMLEVKYRGKEGLEMVAKADLVARVKSYLSAGKKNAA